MTAVRYEVAERVAWITIDRPEAHNALNQAVRDGLWDAFRRFADDDGAYVGVLTGAGEKAFCAGADLKEMSSTGLQVPGPGFIPQLGRTIHTDKPVIASVNGVAYAGGFLLAQMCDLCVAAEHARFAITEAKWSRGMPWAAPLPWMIPPRVALELMLTAQPIDARRAHEIGLVNRVVPGPELREATAELARTVARNAPLTVRAAKRMVYDRASFDEAEAIFEPVYTSEDAQEGPRAFAEKRDPVWRGR